MKVVILMPWRGDEGGRRDELRFFTQTWLQKYHPDWQIIMGESPEGAFNRGAAINDAARKAGDWDVAVISDADNIADPDMLRRAVARAHEINGCVFPYNTYLYLDEFSTDRLIADDNWFVCPEHRPASHDTHPGTKWGNTGFRWTVGLKHTSGIQALSRTAYEQIGGFLELGGWGYEDCCTEAMLQTFVTAPIEHLDGSAFHFYHSSHTDTTVNKKVYGAVNKKISDRLHQMISNPARMREFLSGHPIPGDPIEDLVYLPPYDPDKPQYYWVKAWHGLREHPEIRFAFLAKLGVQQLNDPFPHMRYETLYMPPTSTLLGEIGGLEDLPPKRNKKLSDRPLLDPAVVGGDRTVLMEFCSAMISNWAGQHDAPPQGEQYWANVIAYSGFPGMRDRRYPRLVTDAWVCTTEPVTCHPVIWFSANSDKLG